MERWKFILLRLMRQAWLRSAIYGLAGIAAALLAARLQPYISEDVAVRVGADSVGNILGVMASSMLAVTTFSLTTMVAALTSASNSGTPRATTLLTQDSTAQNALATFIGAFLFSIVGIIALSTGIYGARGRLVLLIATVLVICVVVVTLLRWIHHLASFGRVGQTVDRVEEAASDSLRRWCRSPFQGAARRTGPAGPFALRAEAIGYLQNVDVPRREDLARKHGLVIDVNALPGAFVDPSRPIAFLQGAPGDEVRGSLCDCFLIGDQRSFEQDPRFGFVVLAEVASRALSSAINDPGTAIDVIGTGVRLFAVLRERDDGSEVTHEHVRLPPLSIDDMFDDFFAPIARYGAGTLEVGIRLQKALASLAALSPELFGTAARRHADHALRRALAALSDADDRERLRRESATAPGGL
ncbi:DUF2254 domain-containing protein [Microvirga pudoricolor]|uniref:DUF2254 domain-containing protein n=1 Tax=Microvirga pudoricolor TaxID=2778729 RepID=UPI001950A6D5|nr:DUF2254 domain-containing protein [Microvirga pudoricolor]MBM6595006.1 DUF2254 domain-containing protein [Microvirga pudoricolor]